MRDKKRIIKVLLALLVLMPLASAWSVELGVKIGGNLSVLTLTQNTEPWENRISWQAGVAVSFPFSRYWRLVPEVLAVNYCSKMENTTGDMTLDFTLSRTRIQVPVLLEYLFLGGKKGWQPFLLIGPHFMYNIGNRLRVVVDGEDEADLEERFEKIDFGLVAGLGLEIPMRKSARNLTFELRYSLGFLNQFPDTDKGSMKHNAFMLLVGVTL